MQETITRVVAFLLKYFYTISPVARAYINMLTNYRIAQKIAQGYWATEQFFYSLAQWIVAKIASILGL